MTKWCNFFQHLKVGQLHRNCTGTLASCWEKCKRQEGWYIGKSSKSLLEQGLLTARCKFFNQTNVALSCKVGGWRNKGFGWEMGQMGRKREERRNSHAKKKEGRKKKWELGGRRGGNSHGRKKGDMGGKGWQWVQGGIFLHRSNSKQVPELPFPASCCLVLLTKKQACKISQIKTIANFAGQVDNRVSIKLAILQATESAVLCWDET